MRMGSDEVQPPELLGLRDGGNWLFDGEKSAMEPELLNPRKSQLTAAMMIIRDIEELEPFLFDQSSLSLFLSLSFCRGGSKRSAAKPMEPKAPLTARQNSSPASQKVCGACLLLFARE